ncbi:hypothetical protein [Streptomyces sp. NPDC054837]
MQLSGAYWLETPVVEHATGWRCSGTREPQPGAFGGSDMTAMAHIARMCRHQEARDAHGRDTYWHNTDAYRLPMHFVTGAENRMFLPVGLRRTYDRLCQLHGRDLYRYDTIPGYAHLDLWLGAGSARDVYPTVLAELEKHN